MSRKSRAWTEPFERYKQYRVENIRDNIRPDFEGLTLNPLTWKIW